jgi:hypothetical protein
VRFSYVHRVLKSDEYKELEFQYHVIVNPKKAETHEYALHVTFSVSKYKMFLAFSETMYLDIF